MSLSMLRQLKHTRNIPVVKVESDPMTKGLSIMSTGNQDAADTWP